MLAKEKIRKEFLTKRLNLKTVQLEEYSKGIAENVLSVIPKSAKSILIFLSIKQKNEVKTSFILEKLANRKLYIPKTIGKNQMEACLFTPNTKLTENLWKILEPITCKKIDPQELDVVFLPLLAVNKEGYRVGYGGGFYDRYLTQCKPNCLKIGLGFFEPIPDLGWQDKYDIALDFYITPEKIYSFGSKTISPT